MNRSKLTRLFAGFTAALLTAGTLSLGVFAVPAQEDTQIRIFHTNGVHSRYDASVNDDGTLSGFGYARMKTLVDTYSQGVDKTLVFDAGDTFHGQPFATLNRGLSIAQLMDVVGYDAVVAGNHDFNYGASRTPTLARYAGATLLGANVLNKDPGTVLKGFTANKMYRVGDVQIGAVVAVNAGGDIYDYENHEIIGGAQKEGVFYPAEQLLMQKMEMPMGNTTIGCVMTNAKLTKAQANKLAAMAHDGYAHAITPTHTMSDGDTIFAMASGTASCDFNLLGALAVKCVEQAVINGVKQAKSAYGLPAYQKK